MLASLTISNIVLIDRLTIDFSKGLSALTGETGAGKSILLDSLSLLCGARADLGLIRKGTEQASIIGSFDLQDNHEVFKDLKEQGVECDQPLILKRVLTSDGRSKAFINDQPVSAALLRQTGEKLMEIHGQFETHTLLDPQNYITLLDEFAGHKKLREETKSRWHKWKDYEKQLSNLMENIEKVRREEEFYRTSLEDLDALSPKTGEEETLSCLRERLKKREQISGNIGTAIEGLNQIEGISGTVWRSLERLGDDAKAAIGAMERFNAEMQEVLSSLNDLSDEIENTEYTLQEIDDRLFSLKAQARKHGCTIDDLCKKRDEIAVLLDTINAQDKNLNCLMRQVTQEKKNYTDAATELSQSRKKAAVKLQKLVMKELPPLKLEKAKFVLDVAGREENEWGEHGMDQVRFLVSTNPGADPGPLNKIASGGEMARFMLALKVVLVEVGTAETLIFDEVDSGIGGATAAAVGERLAQLAKMRQVLVVTHSPQVAATAKNHWIVSKGGSKTVTTNVVALSKISERQEEIARMLSGVDITQEARAAALKLLEASAA